MAKIIIFFENPYPDKEIICSDTNLLFYIRKIYFNERRQFRFFCRFAYSKKKTMTETEARIIHLRKELDEHNYNYYVLNAPTISDREFDRMME